MCVWQKIPWSTANTANKESNISIILGQKILSSFKKYILNFSIF